MTLFTIVAAISDPDFIIGMNGTMPWRIPSDLAYFKELTIGKPIIMGRKTWDSIPERFRPLPDRRNIVITRNEAHAKSIRKNGGEPVMSYEAACELVASDHAASIVGGGEIYRQALAHANRMEITLVRMNRPEGTLTSFPPWSWAEWRTEASEDQYEERRPSDSHATRRITLVRST